VTRYTPLWLQAGSYAAGVDRRLIAAIWPNPVTTGCAVTTASAMNLNVAAGSVVVPTANNTGSTLCVSDAVEVVTLPTAPASGLNRIDVVCCTVASTDIGSGTGDAWSFTVVSSTAVASPVAPTIPAGSVAVAQVLVVGGSASISAANITDRRNPATARDTLHAKVYRQAAWTVPAAAGTVVPYDTVQRDPAGMWKSAQTGFVVPAAGLYLLSAVINAGGGTGNFVGLTFQDNGAQIATVGAHGSMAYGIGPALSTPVLCSAGDLLQVLAGANVAAAAQTGVTTNFATVDYLGTG
jgi:hypothetical protein